jgi:predicted Zn-dependent protease
MVWPRVGLKYQHLRTERKIALSLKRVWREVMLKAILLALVLVFTLTAYVFSEQAALIPLKELRAQADEVLRQPNVSARKDIEVVFKLVDRLLEENQQEDAEKYIVQGLKHFPWNLEYQMVYAEMLAKKGKHEKAEEKAALVFEYGETDALIDRAGKILKKDPLPQFAKISTLPGNDHCVVLVPFQGCDKWLIARIRDELSTTLHIPVFIQTINAKYPLYSRDRRQAIVNRLRRQLIENMKDIQVADGMKNLGLTKEDLKEDTNVLRLMKYLLRNSGAEKIAQFDAYLKDSIGKDPQWDACQLQDTLFQAVAPCRRKNVAYLGITSVDIYTDDYNFLFGAANTSGGIMSYCRFTADFNNDIPNQNRLIKRTLMQSLASVGHIYGIKRCTDPTCARAYPNSLSEHDAKKGTLCSECKNAFKTLFESGKKR